MSEAPVIFKTINDVLADMTHLSVRFFMVQNASISITLDYHGGYNITFAYQHRGRFKNILNNTDKKAIVDGLFRCVHFVQIENMDRHTIYVNCVFPDAITEMAFLDEMERRGKT